MKQDPTNDCVVLVAGATGLVGRECVRLLSAQAGIAEVRALVRRPGAMGAPHPGVREVLVDYANLNPHDDRFRVDQVFCALGTTLRTAGSREAFHRVDFDYPLQIAEAALAGGARHCLLVSAAGADPGSRFFYNRVKGQLEAAITRLGFRSVTIARPSLLVGERASWRVGEEIGKRLGWMLPERWKPVPADRVARALIQAVLADAPGVRIIENPELRMAG